MASDADLIGRSLSGDTEAFMEVVCRHEVAIGLPVSSVSTSTGVPPATETYQVFRVTLADIKAGEF